MRVFVTDGDTKHSLAVVRSLARKGIDVCVGSDKRWLSLSSYSRYCRQRVLYPPQAHGEEFVDFLADWMEREGADVLLPMRDVTTRLVSEHRDRFQRCTRLVIADEDSMAIALSKTRTIQFAAELGIPIPRTSCLDSLSHARAIAEELEYPVVLKRPYGSGGIRYVNSPGDMADAYRSVTGEGGSPEEPTLAQEYIEGPGYGFFALFDHGEPKAIFMHRRVREYPVTGGPSAVAESVSCPVLKEYGLRLLKALNWHGVAMVEFKKDMRDGVYKLLEMNPKFWGSLDLAIAAGVDFPYLAVQLALGREVEPVLRYREGLKFRWLFPLEVLHLLARPSSLGHFMRDFFDTDTEYDISLRDPLPNIVQVFQIPGYIVFFKGKFRYPHGRPLVRRGRTAPAKAEGSTAS